MSIACCEFFPCAADAARRPGGRPVRRPAADARPGHGLPLAAQAADDRRAVARARPGRRRAAAADRARICATTGTTVILVEQSVNVALTVAETAYFMEKGEIRFHGPTAELLERPDVLRSVFLEGACVGAAASSLERTNGASRQPTRSSPLAPSSTTERSPTASTAVPALATECAHPAASAASAPSTRCRSRSRPARSSASSAQRRRQDDAVRRHLRLHAARPRPHRARWPRHHRAVTRISGRCRAWDARSRTPACGPRSTVEETHRGGARALDRRARPASAGPAPARRVRLRGAAPRSGSTS